MTSNSFSQQYVNQLDFSQLKQIDYCGQCKFFDNGCTTSQIENKYGNSGTEACTEFQIRTKDIV